MASCHSFQPLNDNDKNSDIKINDKALLYRSDFTVIMSIRSRVIDSITNGLNLT